MRRAARPLLYLGVFVVVFGLAIAHAAFIGALLLHRLEPLRVDAGLRRHPLRHRLRVRAARRAPVASGRARSGGRRRLPGRLVDLAPPAVRRRCPAAAVRGLRLGPPAAGLVPALRRAGRRRAVARRGPRPRRRGRGPDEVAALDLELHASPERPASIVGQLHRRATCRTAGARSARGAPRRDRCPPCSCSTARRRTTPAIVAQAAVAPRARRAGPIAHAVLRGVAGQAARSPSSSARRCSSTSARCTAPATAGPSASSTSRSPCSACVAARRRPPVRVVGQPARQPRPALLPAGAGRQGRRPPSRS